MTTIPNQPAPGGHDRFDTIEALLKRYPDVAEHEVHELRQWFRKDATAFDVASMASKESVAGGYRRFRADHIDKIGPAEVIRMIVIVAVSAALIVGLIALGA